MIGSVARGASWLAVGQVLSQGYLTAGAIIAASVMDPNKFGLVTIQVVLVSGLLLMADGGFATAIVREPQDVRPKLRFLAVVSGVGVGAIAAGAVSILTGPPDLSLLVLSALSPAAAFSLGQHASLVADLKFRAVGVSQGGAAIVALAVAASLLWTQPNSWAIPASFVAYLVTIVALQGAAARGLSHLLVGSIGRRPMRFAAGAFGSTALNYFGGNVDYAIVGATLGQGPLGVYALGYIISTSIQTRVMSLANRAAYPVMVRMSPADRMRWYGSLLGLVTALAIPTYALLYVLAPPAINLWFGPSWREAIPITRSLLAAGLAFTVGTSVGPLLLSFGRSDLLVVFGIIRLLGVGTAVALTAGAGLTAVTVGVVAYAWLAVPLTLALSMRAVGGSSLALASYRRTIPSALPPVLLSIVSVPLADTPLGLLLAGVAVLLGAFGGVRMARDPQTRA